MAPEQTTGATTGPPADISAAACLLTYALTGTPPFGEGQTEAVVYRIVHQEPDLAALNAALGSSADDGHEELRALIGDCLAKNPQQRPDSAAILQRLPSPTPLPEPGWLPAAHAAAIERRAAAATKALEGIADLLDEAPGDRAIDEEPPRRRATWLRAPSFRQSWGWPSSSPSSWRAAEAAPTPRSWGRRPPPRP